MNLLPKNHAQFKQKQYWNSFFKQLSKKEAFEWYGKFSYYRQTLFIIINQLSISNNKTKTFRIANIGCGNSTLGQDIIKGYPIYDISIDNFDYSQTVIQKMKKNNKYQKLCYQVCDLFVPIKKQYMGIYDIIIDKGTLDAVLPQQNVQNILQIKQKYFNNIKYMLRSGNGSYIIISMLQSFIIKTILQSFDSSYMITIYQKRIQDSQLQPFLIDIRRSKVDTKQRLKLMTHNKIMRQMDYAQAIKQISRIQQVNSQVNMVKQLKIGNISKFDVFIPNTQVLRYGLTIIDHTDYNIISKNTCSIFIVPQGKQYLPLFSTQSGLKQFIEQIDSSRLIVVKLIIGQEYKDVQMIKKELDNMIDDLIQKNVKGKDVPYLTDGSIGQRYILYQDQDIFIQELRMDDQCFRRLIRKRNINIVQSSFKIKQSLQKVESNVYSKVYNKNSIVIDNNYLDHTDNIIVSYITKLLNNKQSLSFLHIEGSACSVPRYLQRHILNSTHIITQSSKSIIQNCGKYFQWPKQRFQHRNQDLFKYIQQYQGKQSMYDSIIINANNYNELYYSRDNIKKMEGILKSQGIIMISINSCMVEYYKQIQQKILDNVDDRFIVIKSISQNKSVVYCLYKLYKQKDVEGYEKKENSIIIEKEKDNEVLQKQKESIVERQDIKKEQDSSKFEEQIKMIKMKLRYKDINEEQFMFKIIKPDDNEKQDKKKKNKKNKKK